MSFIIIINLEIEKYKECQRKYIVISIFFFFCISQLSSITLLWEIRSVNNKQFRPLITICLKDVIRSVENYEKNLTVSFQLKCTSQYATEGTNL